MRHAAEMQERLRKMLTKDKIGDAGFVSALKRDVGRVLKDYFELSDEPELTVAVNADVLVEDVLFLLQAVAAEVDAGLNVETESVDHGLTSFLV